LGGNIQVDIDLDTQVVVRRVEGSITQSIVRDIEWAFAGEGTPHILEFPVFDNVDFHIILGDDSLFEINVFERYPLLLGWWDGLTDRLYVMQIINSKSTHVPSIWTLRK
jgi:hypothetical protein